MEKEDLSGEIIAINERLCSIESQVEDFLNKEDIYLLRGELMDIINFNKDNLVKVNQMMLELKGIVAMARGAIQEAHNVCVVRNTQKNTENSQLRKLLREVGKILGKEG